MATALRRLWARFRRLPWWRMAAGIAAGAAGLVATLLLRLIGLGIFLPEQALQFAIGSIPGSVESFFIDTLGEGAKGLGFVSALVAVLAAFGIGALPFRWAQRFVPSRWGVILVYTLLTAGVVLLGVLPAIGAGLAGSRTESGAGFAIFSQLVGAWIYASVLDYLLVEFKSRHPEGFSPSRRQFLIGGASAIGLLALAYTTFSYAVVAPARLAFASAAELFAKEVTPTDEFYVVTKNLIDPVVDPTSWQLVVKPLSPSASPLTLSYADIQTRMASGTLPPVTQFATMECVSNEVGGNLIGNAKWTGVRLADLLQAAGVEPTATWIEFTCTDGYTVAIPRAKAVDPATLLVIQMNGAPLQSRHGAPARILVPGKYGMYSAKWVTEIAALSDYAAGYWQARGWTPDGPIHTEAIIALPAPDSVVHGTVTLGGVALSAAQGISKVEISTDGGSTWQSATLHLPPTDPMLSWVLWTFDWSPSSGGAYRIAARAYDGTGAPQDPTTLPPFPNGASGYDSIVLYVGG
jgi:DMSO/TMAO reductase YedYZ molybdopterin-dependent catalytic subunit